MVGSGMMMQIELFPHNEEGYNDLVNRLVDSNFSFLERATGTGKSYILIKFLVEQYTGKRVLFVTLHDSMFKQLTERDMLALGTSKDIYEKLDCVLYSSICKHSASWYYDNYDCIIFDEAHHCGAPQWGERIAELRDLIRNSEDKKMIGVTATGIRYLDDYMDVSKEFFDNNTASRLLIPEAMLRVILPVPYYFIDSSATSLDVIDKIQRKLRKLDNYKELDVIREKVEFYKKKIREKADKNTVLKKHNVKQGEKYIVFCESKEELKKLKEEINFWFKDISPLEIYEAHSSQSNNVNQNQIDLFEGNNNPKTIKVMLAVDMFNEGLHIKGVDGIIMNRKTASPIIYLQQLGRALSFSVRKKQIKIFDFAGNATRIDIIYNMYKDFIATAKEKIKENNEDEGYYREIINRFKIIDEGSELIEELETINKFLDENYLNSQKIKIYILILKNYIENINQDFMTLLRNKKIDREHLKVYNELKRMSDSLSFDDYVELNKLGIIISDYQENDKILEKIKINGNFKNVIDSEINDVIYQYNLFYITNNRRPTDIECKELVAKYRKILSDMKKKGAFKYLKKVDYPLNVEELLLLKDYPSKESINEYIEFIENKYKNGIILDKLEKRTIFEISKLISLKEANIISILVNNNVIKIDNILKKYLEEYPNEKFIDANKFVEIPEIKMAVDVLHKYAIYVTNQQFQLLLEMGIALPDEINMSLEERKEKLGTYESFYEKYENIKNMKARSIVEFIVGNGRRPDFNKLEEREIAIEYNSLFYEKK